MINDTQLPNQSEQKTQWQCENYKRIVYVEYFFPFSSYFCKMLLQLRWNIARASAAIYQRSDFNPRKVKKTNRKLC